LYIKYTDTVGNEATYYISIYVDDTIAPEIKNVTNKSVNITNNDDGGVVDYSEITLTDNYSNVENIKCTFKLSISTQTYECNSNGDIIVEGIKYASYTGVKGSNGVDDVRFNFYIAGDYTITFVFTETHSKFANVYSP
jgi:hypothetical protein